MVASTEEEVERIFIAPWLNEELRKALDPEEQGDLDYIFPAPDISARTKAIEDGMAKAQAQAALGVAKAQAQAARVLKGEGVQVQIEHPA